LAVPHENARRRALERLGDARAGLDDREVGVRPGTCKHFTGFQNGTCKAGVNYRELVGGPDLGWAARLGCIKDSPLNKPPLSECAKFEEPTKEEVEAWELDITLRSNANIEAIRRIQKLKPERGTVGSIECPLCKGRLQYSVAKLNGHVWGRCETKDCLAWMM
jgi:hypothetical protein